MIKYKKNASKAAMLKAEAKETQEKAEPRWWQKKEKAMGVEKHSQKEK